MRVRDVVPLLCVVDGRLVPTRSVVPRVPVVLPLVPVALVVVERPAVPVLRVVEPTREPVTIRPFSSRVIPLREDVVRVLPTVDVRLLDVVEPTRRLKLPLFSERTDEPIGLTAYLLPE